jgi:predicted enzyme related to lactoylglutathione lyase
MSTIVHFQIPSDNVERSKKFYSDMFGWNFEKVPPEKLPEGEEHWGITTKDHEGNLLVSHLLMSILPK